METVSWAEYGRGGQNIAQCGEPEQRCVERRAEGGGRAQGWHGRPATASSERKKKGNELWA